MRPEQALAGGGWVKWIAGASNQDLAAIEDLAGIYALAGAHCLDLAADPAVVAAARRGVAWAERQRGRPWGADRPWLMLSLSDGADPHFRKAWFDPRRCPPDCVRPCERVCPALAIDASGVVAERCYGCGRCLPACPLGLIHEHSQVLAAEAMPTLLRQLQPDAIELHTQPGRVEAFAARLDQLAASGVRLWRLAVSAGADVSPAELWQRYVLVRRHGLQPLWQLDGRPMSGDVGAGTARAAVRLLAERLAAMPPGPVQLAGGTNDRTWPLLQRRGALARHCAGVAFGGVARSLLQPLLLAAQQRRRSLLADAELWPQALHQARALLAPWLERGQFSLPGPLSRDARAAALAARPGHTIYN